MFPGTAEQHSNSSAGARPPGNAMTAMLSPGEPGQTSAPPSKGISSTAAGCKPHWAPHASLPGAHRPHVAASSRPANQQHSAPQPWAFPGLSAPVQSSSAQQAQHAGSACSGGGKGAAFNAYQAYQAALCPLGGPEPSCPGMKLAVYGSSAQCPSSVGVSYGITMLVSMHCCQNGRGVQAC